MAGANKIKESDKFTALERKVALISVLGSVLQVFAETHLQFKVLRDGKDDERLEEAYRAFFKYPSKALKPLSTKMKLEILEIPKVDPICDIIERLPKIYNCFCFFALSAELDELLDTKDGNGLELFLKEAPPLKKYDPKLYRIFHASTY